MSSLTRGAAPCLALALAVLLALAAWAQTDAGQKIPVTLGFANLAGSDVQSLVNEDSAALSPLFRHVVTPQPHQIPVAPVLFVYAHFNADGTIGGSKSGIREIVQLAKASIVVVATPNSADSISATAGLPGPKSANLVFTLDRSGPAFARFFRSLFQRMRGGEDMLLAWVELAPQGPVPHDPSAVPQTMMLAEAGRLAFPK